MTMAAVIESRAADEARSQPSRIARVEILHDLAAAEAVWRGLERSAFCTPYQRFDLLSAWQRHVGEREGVEPFIVVASDRDGEPLLLLPLGIKRRRGARVASFLGGKHATFNMALWQRDFFSRAAKADLDALLADLRAHGRADVLALTQQPRHWQGLANPFALLSGQPSANDCPVLMMAKDGAPASRVSNSFRRRLKGKERKLQASPGYRYRLANSDAD